MTKDEVLGQVWFRSLFGDFPREVQIRCAIFMSHQLPPPDEMEFASLVSYLVEIGRRMGRNDFRRQLTEMLAPEEVQVALKSLERDGVKVE